jgi:hypothetical protein
MVIVVLQEQLLLRERELHDQERALVARENGVVEAEHALGRARMECDAVHDQPMIIQQDYLARVCAFTASQRRSLEFHRVLSERQSDLSMQEMDLERLEGELAEDQARGLYSFDGRDLSAEVEKLRKRVVGVEDEQAIEVEQLSWSVREISDALVDLNVLPIRDIPSQPRSAKDVLAVFILVLERLWEEHASGFGSQA